MGLIHVYTGDGKGKTTAAIGLATRFLGQGGKVILVQFLKGQETGEVKFFEKNENISVYRLSKNYGFTFTMNDRIKETVKKEHHQILENACIDMEKFQKQGAVLMIFDECAGALSTCLLDKNEILNILDSLHENVEIVLTGRDFPNEILELADYVSDIHAAKHPMDQGIMARKGIEF